MKKILFLITYIILLSCSAQNNIELEKLGIFGNIEKYQVIKIEILDQKKIDTTQIETYLYDDMNKLIESQLKILIVDYNISRKFIYNQKNQRIKDILKDHNNKASEYNYVYKNDLIIDINSEQKSKNKINYFNNHFFYDKTKLIKSKFKLYNIIPETKDTIFEETGELHYKNGFLSKEKLNYHSSDTLPLTINKSYIRDEKGFLKEKFESFEEEGKKHQFTYKYKIDNLGSWIEQKEFKDGNLNVIYKRIITYK